MKLLEKIISIYAPLTCLSCGQEGDVACRDCLAALPLPKNICYRCHALSRHGRTCIDCRKESHLVSANAATAYSGVAKDLVWSLKFGRVQAAADIMAVRLTELYGRLVTDDVLIVPVPTATKRVRSRGYDQAVLIARSFAKQTGRSYCPLLMRIGSQEQIGADKIMRYEQLRGVFKVKNLAAIQNARILLIDDVMTTGATLETAATILKAAGAQSVGALTFAQTQLHYTADDASD